MTHSRRDSIRSVDVGVIGWVVGVDRDQVAGVGAIGRGALHTFSALRAVDEDGLAAVEAMKPLEEAEPVNPGETVSSIN